jgi:glycosyltransferase involved in cell wall biosynthesis
LEEHARPWQARDVPGIRRHKLQLELSLVVPMYNEAQNVAALVQETCAALRGRAFELLRVDDGSQDATPVEALRLREQSQLRVLQHLRQHGQSAALYFRGGGEPCSLSRHFG